MTESTIATAPGGDSARLLVAFLHSTLDGFIATSEGTFWNRFRWDHEEMEWNNEQFRLADTWVLGRRMYETIVPWWTQVAAGTVPSDAGDLTAADRDFAQLLGKLTKIVVSTTLTATADRQVIADDVASRLRQLKRQPGANIMLSCGPALLSELAEQPGVIDQYLVIVHPAAIGSGIALFAPLTDELQLDTMEVKPFDGGALALRYRPAAAP